MNRFALRMNDRFFGQGRMDRNRQQMATKCASQTARFLTASSAGWPCANPLVAVAQETVLVRNPVEVGQLVPTGLRLLPWKTAAVAG